MNRRPRLHLTGKAGWINDPLGLTYHEGRYHLFFQYVPGAAAWAPSCHWGHATSPDLLHWTEGPVALAPGDGDDGCWSGSLVRPSPDSAYIFYTSVLTPDFAIGKIRRALPEDGDWAAWCKEDVVVEAPPHVTLTAFRDPYVFSDGDCWRMVIGAGLTDGTGTALAYASSDLSDWEYEGLLASRSASETDPIWTGTIWECAQLVQVGDRHVLVVSVCDQDALHYVAGAVGSYSDGQFEPESWTRLTYGDPAPYAASAYRDDEGRPGLIAWFRGVVDPERAWVGALTVPMLLTLDDAGRPQLAPHPNVTRSRQEPLTDARWSEDVCVDVEWSPTEGEKLAVSDAGGQPMAELLATQGELTLMVPGGAPYQMPWDSSDVRLLLDGPLLEVFSVGSVMGAVIDPQHRRIDARGSSYRSWELA